MHQMPCPDPVLSQKECIPCHKGAKRLTPDAIAEMLPRLMGWSLSKDEKWLEKSFAFRNFSQGLDFINHVGLIAESQNHHPDITLGWGYAGIRLQTHTVGGLHENDFILAAKIDTLTP